MLQGNKTRFAVALLAVLLISGVVAGRGRHLEQRKSVHQSRAMTADVVFLRGVIPPFALASVVPPALPALGFFHPASAGRGTYLYAPLSIPVTRPPPRLS
jgi:hypothetical protein